MRRFLQLQILPLIALALLGSMNAVRSSYALGSKSDQPLQMEGRKNWIVKISGLNTDGYFSSLKKRVRHKLFTFGRKHTKLEVVSTEVSDGALFLKFQDTVKLKKFADHLRAELVQKLPTHITDAPDAVNLIVSNDQKNTIKIAPSEEMLRDAEEKAIQYYIGYLKYVLQNVYGSQPNIQRFDKNKIAIRFEEKNSENSYLRHDYSLNGYLSFHEIYRGDDENSEQFSPPIGSELVEDYHNPKKLHLVKKAKLLTNEDLNFFRVKHDPSSGMTVFSIGFNAFGAKLLSEISKKNIGKPFGIIYENKHLGLRKVLSAPVLKSAMLDGRAHIIGSFSLKDAKKIAATVKPGNFNLNIEVIEDRKTLRKKE